MPTTITTTTIYTATQHLPLSPCTALWHGTPKTKLWQLSFQMFLIPASSPSCVLKYIPLPPPPPFKQQPGTSPYHPALLFIIAYLKPSRHGLVLGLGSI